MPEKYLPFELIPGMPKELCVSRLVDGEEGLIVILKEFGKTRRFRLTFSGQTAYRAIDEQFRSRTIHHIAQEISFPQPFFVVENSTWLRWLDEESDGLLGGRGFIHIAVMTTDICLDVACTAKPACEVES